MVYSRQAERFIQTLPSLVVDWRDVWYQRDAGEGVREIDHTRLHSISPTSNTTTNITFPQHKHSHPYIHRAVGPFPLAVGLIRPLDHTLGLMIWLSLPPLAFHSMGVHTDPKALSPNMTAHLSNTPPVG